MYLKSYCRRGEKQLFAVFTVGRAKGTDGRLAGKNIDKGLCRDHLSQFFFYR